MGEKKGQMGLFKAVGYPQKPIGQRRFFKFIWKLPKMGIPPNGWFIRKIPFEMNDLAVPPFQETSI